jgi:hypothetical protein
MNEADFKTVLGAYNDQWRVTDRSRNNLDGSGHAWPDYSKICYVKNTTTNFPHATRCYGQEQNPAPSDVSTGLFSNWFS